MVDLRSKRVRIALYLLGFFILVVARVFVYENFDRYIADATTRLLVSQAYKFILWVLPVFLYLHFVDKTDPFTYLKLSTSPRQAWRWSLGVVAAGALWQILEIRFRGDEIGALSTNAILALALIPLFEEIPIHGFILNELAEIMAFPKALTLSAGYFVLLHMPGWLFISPGKTSGEMLVDGVAIFVVIGLIGGWLMKRSNSLYPSILLHLINNFISGV